MPRTAVHVWTFAAMAATMFGWVLYVIAGSPGGLMAYLVDDSFYYLIPAASFARGGGWTFDHVTPTAGFQPLYALTAAAVSLGAGRTAALPVAMAIVSALAAVTGVWLWLARSREMYGPECGSMAAALTFASPVVFMQLVGGLEWGLVVMVTALFVWTTLRPNPSLPLTAAAAFLACYTRVDLALFVAVFTVSLAASQWWSGRATLRRAAGLTAAAAGGAAAALGVTALGSWLITGAWVPNSVEVKRFWSTFSPFEPAHSWRLLMSGTGPGAALTSVREALNLQTRIVFGVFVASTAAVCLHEWRRSAERRAAAIASALVIVCYSLAYARGVHIIWDHYSGITVIPIALVLAGFLSVVGRFRPAIAVALAAGCVFAATRASWGGNLGNLVVAGQAGRMAAEVPAGSRIAAWNAGIAGWASEDRVVNIDGLANAEVVSAIKGGTIGCYLAKARIDHLLDWGYMFPTQFDTDATPDQEARRQFLIERNGYDPSQLMKCASVRAIVEDPRVPKYGLRLLILEPECTSALCERTLHP